MYISMIFASFYKYIIIKCQIKLNFYKSFVLKNVENYHNKKNSYNNNLNYNKICN